MVAILFADLCGSTPLANELGAEGMHGLLTRYFELVDSTIAQCGGTVDTHIGDGVMAIFGLDRAPEVACRQALETYYADFR